MKFQVHTHVPTSNNTREAYKPQIPNSYGPCSLDKGVAMTRGGGGYIDCVESSVTWCGLSTEVPMLRIGYTISCVFSVSDPPAFLPPF